ncbi:uncharacterized protein LOC141685317 [Apium graveolens]|uniref:uncharacterized protein LOC141685317 n=1 Tax=Apium graveolens TaxID=4045 RepID=UPI003D7B859F
MSCVTKQFIEKKKEIRQANLDYQLCKISQRHSECIKIGESTAIDSLKRFCRVIIEVFGQQYLRSPNANDVARLLYIDLTQGIAPPTHYIIQGKVYNTGYYLADGPTRFWNKNVLQDIMTMCIIMHDMIIEDKRDLSAPIQEPIGIPDPEVETVENDENARFQ